MQKDRSKQFGEFVEWFENHIKGYEKGEGQIFFNRLLQAFGNKGILEVGATCEERVKKRKGTMGFADFVWKPRVIIELKERGTLLNKHYEQAFEYWWTLVPNRPQYMILCNFDEFWIYDLNLQINDPVHKLQTRNLAKDWGALAFLFPKAEKPVFNNNNVEVTVEAAKILGSMFISMSKRRIEPTIAQRFVLQMVVALFAEDVNLIPKYTIHKILAEAVKDPISQKEIGDLFAAMATELPSKKPKKYREISYFNGGIFNKVETVELNFKEIDLLYEASKQDWSKVRPSIFGSIFEASMDPAKRHDLGAHFTSEIDIQKIVFPTIVKPIREKIEKAKSQKTAKAYKKLLQDLHNFKVLDPACGSGNFLYVAFRELRRLEVEILELLEEQTSSKQTVMAMISPKNFFGIDVNGFGLELAKVALCIGRKLSADEFKIHDNILPFENLDQNFIATDALFVDWPKADAIIGNPPFLGSRKMRASGFTDDYMKKLRSLYSKDTFPGNADYCCYWFRRAHEEPAKYVGLVGSNSISQNESRTASLGFIESNGGIIHYAISTQVWSGDAKVHVSIVNWVKEETSFARILDGKEVDFINSSLKSEVDVTSAHALLQNENICYQGVIPGSKSFVLTNEILKHSQFSKSDLRVIKHYSTGDNLTDSADYSPNRFIIDFQLMDIEQASEHRAVFEYLKKHPKRKKSGKWWLYTRPRPEMRKTLASLDYYFAIPRVSKWTIPVIQKKSFLLGDAAWAVCSDDFYLLGVLTSKLHRDWVKAQASSLKGDTRYTNTTCFETFPFLWNISKKQKNSVRKAMENLNEYRLEVMKKNNYGITKLYNDFFHEPDSKLFQLHQSLDKIVCGLYNLKYDPNHNYNHQLFLINQEMYKKQADE